MALVSQNVKNLKGGISQQPDILRFPEQGAEQINGWSSETEGLQKRPPMVFTKTLGGKGSLGTWPYIHLINRDENEQYYAAFTGQGIRVFDLSGKEYAVRGNLDYVRCNSPRDELRMVTVADYTFITNRNYVCRSAGQLSDNGAFRADGDALINVRGGQYGRTLQVAFNGALRASYTIPDGSQKEHVTNTDAQWLAEELARQIREKTPGWEINVGPGFIHIKAPGNDHIWDLWTKDGYADQLINSVSHYVQSFNKLPLQAPAGYSVQIVGDTSKTADRYYVYFDWERKVWTERSGWNIRYTFDGNTMPHALVRTSDGNFELQTLPWTNRNSGDDDTNPYPSFIDSTVNDIFFFRNRLGFLSGENIVLSRTSKYFSFFPPSVANLSDDDPIDVAVSHNRVSTLKYAVPFTEELLLWSDEAQFVLSANGILSARSVELNLTTQFDVQDRARPYGIGRNVYFASPRASFTSINRYYAVQDVSSVKNAEDMTAHVPSYIPNGVFDIHGSSTENFASILTGGAESKVFIYKFLYLDEEIRQQSWSHWDFGEGARVLAASSIGSTMFLVIENDFNVFMGYVQFVKNTIDIAGEPYRVFLDAKTTYTIPAGTYNDDTYLTTIDLRTIYGMNFRRGTISVVEPDGRVEVFEEPEGGWNNDPFLRFNGNTEGRRLVVGFNIPFRYEFSKFLIKQTADDGSTNTEDSGRLQLRRAWVNYENSGAFTIEVENQSRLFSYDMAGGRLGSENLRVGRLNLGTGQYRFPVPGNAKYNTVRIVSDNTTPLNVIGCGWEGNYNRRSSGI
ncbi:putative tail tubular protein B [Erwinia phage pEp_SNUABM_10]|nr:putative tail tubular protein B [Erwinia phage pEp_SNUABM_03]QOC57720.1 putative tail tubular protein B [Erwinia phage pEp_SNUABM_10]